MEKSSIVGFKLIYLD